MRSGEINRDEPLIAAVFIIILGYAINAINAVSILEYLKIIKSIRRN